MTEETAREWLRVLNTSESAWPSGYEADGFTVDGWDFEYCGSGDWVLMTYRNGKWVTIDD
jgi:hypothetical protein